jgi:hypothetical protein
MTEIEVQAYYAYITGCRFVNQEHISAFVDTDEERFALAIGLWLSAASDKTHPYGWMTERTKS